MKASMSRAVVCFALGAIALFHYSLSNANLIDLTYGEGAGSFELGTFINGGGIPSGAGPGYMGVAPGDSATITGWTVGGPGDGVDWNVEPVANADTGIHAIDLQHAYSSSIWTSIPTITDNDYYLSFSVAAGANVPPYVTSTIGAVSAGSLVDEIFTATPSASYITQTFTSFTYRFTAIGPMTTIKFQGAGPTGAVSHYGPVIDTVSVSAVPLPAAVWLFGSGLLSLLGLSKFHRRLC